MQSVMLRVVGGMQSVMLSVVGGYAVCDVEGGR